MLPVYSRRNIEKIYCTKVFETPGNRPCQPAVEINQCITSFEGSRNIEICLCGDGKTETEVHFLNPDYEKGCECWDPCLEQSFSRKKKTENHGIFSLNLYVYEGPGYGFGDQPLREANVFFLQYDRGQEASLKRALDFAQRIQRVREDYEYKSLFVLASNGFDYTKCEDNFWALLPQEADLRNFLLNLLDYDSNLVSLLLTFSNILFVQSNTLNNFEVVSREEGMNAAKSIDATYLELNACTGYGVSEAFMTCLNKYVNQTSEILAIKKERDKNRSSAKAFTKSMFKRCVKVAKKNLEKRFSIYE